MNLINIFPALFRYLLRADRVSKQTEKARRPAWLVAQLKERAQLKRDRVRAKRLRDWTGLCEVSLG